MCYLQHSFISLFTLSFIRLFSCSFSRSFVFLLIDSLFHHPIVSKPFIVFIHVFAQPTSLANLFFRLFVRIPSYIQSLHLIRVFGSFVRLIYFVTGQQQLVECDAVDRTTEADDASQST